MKKNYEIKIFGTLFEMLAVKFANSPCCGKIYEPKVPKDLCKKEIMKKRWREKLSNKLRLPILQMGFAHWKFNISVNKIVSILI